MCEPFCIHSCMVTCLELALYCKGSQVVKFDPSAFLGQAWIVFQTVQNDRHSTAECRNVAGGRD